MITIRKHGASTQVYRGEQLVGQEVDSSRKPCLDHYDSGYILDSHIDIDELPTLENITVYDSLYS